MFTSAGNGNVAQEFGHVFGEVGLLLDGHWVLSDGNGACRALGRGEIPLDTRWGLGWSGHGLGLLFPPSPRPRLRPASPRRNCAGPEAHAQHFNSASRTAEGWGYLPDRTHHARFGRRHLTGTGGLTGFPGPSLIAGQPVSPPRPIPGRGSQKRESRLLPPTRVVASRQRPPSRIRPAWAPRAWGPRAETTGTSLLATEIF
jgi:hypothetical protein